MIKHKLLPLAIVGSLAFAACDDGGGNSSSTSHSSNELTITDPHSYARMDEAVVTHLSLDVSVDFDQKLISGTATYDIDNKKAVDAIYLDTRDLNIQSTMADGAETSFEVLPKDVDQPYMGQALKVAIKEGTKQISIKYSTTPGAAALQWLNPQQTAGKKEPFLFTQSQAILARTWIPCQDGPGVRFTYDATVKVPSHLMAVMSASNPTEKNSDGVYHFEMKQRIPSYLMAMAVGDLDFNSIDDVTGVYAEPAMMEPSLYEFEEVAQMLKDAEKLYGKYAWDRYDILTLPPSFPFGGMENPRLTFATPTIIAGDKSLVSLIAHELAHSWSGNLVTNANWNDFWLNEGFTVYFENRIMEALKGEGYAMMLQKLSYQDLLHEIDVISAGAHPEDTKLKLDVAGRDPDEGLTAIAYDKGALFLRHIEYAVGRAQFDEFVKNYFQTHAFQVMTTEGFVDYLEANLIKGDKALAEQINYKGWIYEPKLPANHVAPESNAFEKVDLEIAKFEKGASASTLNTADWTSHEMQHFLRNLPATLSKNQLKDLDAAFNLTTSKNCEEVCLWLVIAIENDYTVAYDRLEDFLVNVGRRKFLSPIYDALVKTPEGKTRALNIYEKARSNYHSVAYNSIDRTLGLNTDGEVATGGGHGHEH